MVKPTDDPFILLMRRGTPQYKHLGDKKFYRTGIVVEQDTWESFKTRCKKELISPSEMLHHLMREYLKR